MNRAGTVILVLASCALAVWLVAIYAQKPEAEITVSAFMTAEGWRLEEVAKWGKAYPVAIYSLMAPDGKQFVLVESSGHVAIAAWSRR
jgi:hypothetical protein